MSSIDLAICCNDRRCCHRLVKGWLGEIDLVGERFDMIAKVNIRKHSVILQGLQAGNLGDEIHDPVITAHEFPQSTDSIAEMLFTVGVCELGCTAKHGRTKDIDPCSESHINRFGGVIVLRNVLEVLREIHLVDKACNSLEVLVPWDIREVVVRGANRALLESVRKDFQGKRFSDIILTWKRTIPRVASRICRWSWSRANASQSPEIVAYLCRVML